MVPSNTLPNSFLNSLPDALLVCNNDGLIIRSNKQVEETLGYNPEELIGNSIETLVPDHFVKSHSNLRKRYSETPKQRGMEQSVNLRAKRKDQSEFPASISLNQITLDGENVTVICIRDISLLIDVHLREKKVEQTQRLESIGLMSAGISHDLHNIIHVILGNIELAELNLPPEHPILEPIENIKSSARQLSELTRQIMTLSSKDNSMEKKEIDLNVITEEMVNLLQSSISKHAAISLQLAEMPAYILAEASQLRQIILNLIINASEAIGNRTGVIEVMIGERYFDENNPYSNHAGNLIVPGSYIFIEVKDTGIGMNKSTIDKLIDPFFSTKNDGRGLGLSVVHGIINTHNGVLDIHSKVNEGTTFKVFIPRIEPQVILTQKSIKATQLNF